MTTSHTPAIALQTLALNAAKQPDLAESSWLCDAVEVVARSHAELLEALKALDEAKGFSVIKPCGSRSHVECAVIPRDLWERVVVPAIAKAEGRA